MRFIALVGLTACSLAEPDLGVVETDLATRCEDPDFCGSNSPLLSAYGTWEFNLKGQYNGQGFRILGFAKNNTFYNLDVRGSRILGLDSAKNIVLEGPDLIDARIYLEAHGKQGAIVITNAATITERVVPNDPLGAYVLDWGIVVDHPLSGPMYAGDDPGAEPVLDDTKPVCPPPRWLEEPGSGSALEWDETLAFMVPLQAVVFEGDRFDPTTRTLSPKPNDDWFNIGCGVHTLAKLRLTRNTIHTSPSWAQAQAALKMLGADYCGGGKAFTFPGEPLVWRDRTAMTYLTIHSPQNDLEARWDQNGAKCINAPRLERTNNPDAAAAFPDVWQAIEDECKRQNREVKKCSNTSPQSLWGSGELVTSANYD